MLVRNFAHKFVYVYNTHFVHIMHDYIALFDLVV